MKYEQLASTYKDDVIAEAMYARELEYFHYEFDSINFMQLLTELPEGSARDDIENRLNDTLAQMDGVDRIYNALKSQITDIEAHQAAVQRAIVKREKQVE